MPSLHLSVFGGIKPAISSRNAQAQQATVAHNTRLRDTVLRPVRTPLEFLPQNHVGAQGSKVCDLHLFQDFGCCIDRPTTFDTGVSVIRPPDPGACGGFDWAVVFSCGCDCAPPYRYKPCTNEREPLTVPGPNKRLNVAEVSTGTMKSVDACCFGQSPDERSYTYTWVDKFGVESPPAPPTLSVKSFDDYVFGLSNFDTPPTNAVCVRIYRATYTLIEKGEAQELDPTVASFQLVEELPIPPFTGSYVDGRKLLDLTFGTLQTEADCPPPCMDQVVMTESGYAVGFSGNSVYVSERHEMHNWPEKNRLELPDKIIAVAAYYDSVFFGTTGRPYRVDIETVTIGQKMDTRVDATPYSDNLPCVGRWTMTPTSFGAMYNSHRGMIALSPRGEAVIITRDRVDEEDWVSWRHTVGTWHDGKYFGVLPAGRGFILDIADTAEGGLDIGDLVTVDLDAEKVFSGTDGRLWFLRDERVYAWNEGKDPATYVWKSKILSTSGHMAFNVARITADFGLPVTVRVYADGRLYSENVVCDSRAFRLCSGGRGREWQIEVEGTTPVHEVSLSTSRVELMER